MKLIMYKISVRSQKYTSMKIEENQLIIIDKSYYKYLLKQFLFCCKVTLNVNRTFAYFDSNIWISNLDDSCNDKNTHKPEIYRLKWKSFSIRNEFFCNIFANSKKH